MNIGVRYRFDESCYVDPGELDQCVFVIESNEVRGLFEMIGEDEVFLVLKPSRRWRYSSGLAAPRTHLYSRTSTVSNRPAFA